MYKPLSYRINLYDSGIYYRKTRFKSTSLYIYSNAHYLRKDIFNLVCIHILTFQFRFTQIFFIAGTVLYIVEKI